MATVKNRVMIQVNDDMKRYVEDMAEQFGVSQSGFINVVLTQYREQRNALETMNEMSKVLEKLEDLQKGLEK